MPEPTSYDDQRNREKIPICQKCFKNPASTTCRECGCPLCIKCVKTHICLKNKKKLPTDGEIKKETQSQQKAQEEVEKKKKEK